MRKEIVRKRYFVSTCSTEKSPLDSILLQEVASAAQESTHPKTNDITRISPLPYSNSGSFIRIQEQTNSASAWQQETRVQWVRASDQSGANRWTTPRLGNRQTGSSLGVNIQNAQVLAEQHMVFQLDLTTPAERPRCHHVSQQSSRIRELPLFLPLLRHNEISFSVSRSTNLIAVLSYFEKPN